MHQSTRSRVRRASPLSEYLSILKSVARGLGYYAFIKGHPSFGAGVSGTRPLDVAIPIADRDVPVVGYAIDSVREYVKHPLGKIFLIGTGSSATRQVALAKACEYIEQDSMIPLTRQDIDYRVNGSDRSGWLFQQLLKWAAADLVEHDAYLVLDADTILLSPQVFELDGKTVLLHSGQYHQPYLDVYARLLREKPPTALSFVSHMMLLSASRLRELKQTIERRNNGRVWYRAILDAIDYREPSAFSEYELYGQWMLAHHSTEIVREYTFHVRDHRVTRQNWQRLEPQYRNQYRSVSLHHWSG